MTHPDLAAVAGVPETRLSAAVLATLPRPAAPPPWTCTGAALLWVARGGASARAVLPPPLGGPVLGVVGGFVRYAATPVGEYDEVLGVVASRTRTSPWGHVAFMAVDSPASLVGGRAGWGMPKTLASLAGGTGLAGFSARGADAEWEVAAAARAAGPRVPLRLAAVARQILPDGTVGASRLVVRARARTALVQVSVTSATPGPLALPSWLRSGRHLGLTLTDLHFTLSPPTPP